MTVYPFHSSSLHWERHQIKLGDLGPNLTTRDFSVKFRSKAPTLLVYDLDSLGWRGLVIGSPLNTAFAGLDVLARMVSPALIRWGETRIDDPVIYKHFEDALREAQIKKDEAPTTLLWPYGNFGAYVNETRKSFGTKATALGDFRVAGWLLPKDASARFEELLNAVLVASNDWAFCGADEGAKNLRPGEADLTRLPFMLGSPLLISGEAPAARAHRLSAMSDALGKVEENLLVTLPSEFDASYHNIVRPRLDLFANASGFGQELLFEDSDETVILKRIRIVEKLSWPTFFVAISDSLDRFENDRGFSGARFSRIRDALRSTLDHLHGVHAWLRDVEEIATQGIS